MATQAAYNLTLVTGAAEVVVAPANARLIKIIPMGAATGTVLIREANAIGTGFAARWFVAAITPAVGVDFDANGVAFAGGITVLLSVAADVWGIVWGPLL